MLKTESVTGIEIFRTGTRADGRTYTRADLQKMVDAFGNVGFQPPIKHACADTDTACKIDMTDARKNFGLPALGYVARLFLRDDVLFADFSNVPRRLAEAIRGRKYDRVGVEIYTSYADASGRKLPLVLKSISFPGALPALTDLDTIEGLYSYEKNQTPKGENFMQTELPKTSFQANGIAVDEAVRQYQSQNPGTDYADALRAVVHEADQAESKAHAEIGRRVVAYQDQWNLSRDEAHKRVLQHDPKLAEFENPLWGPVAIGNLIDLVNAAVKNPDQGDAILRQADRGQAQKAAGDFLNEMAYQLMRHEPLGPGEPGFDAMRYPRFFERALKQYPATADVYNGGPLTMASVAEMLPWKIRQ